MWEVWECGWCARYDTHVPSLSSQECISSDSQKEEDSGLIPRRDRSWGASYGLSRGRAGVLAVVPVTVRRVSVCPGDQDERYVGLLVDASCCDGGVHHRE